MSVKALRGSKLESLDGEIGRVKEFYFDDQHWAIRYLVVDTGNWLTGRQVLISPYAMVAARREGDHIAIDLTRKQIEESPSLNSDKPVSRQFEEDYYGYYGWPIYWGGVYLWGANIHLERDREKWIHSAQDETEWDPHLQSTKDVTGYHLQARDGEMGHVDDFIIDPESWAIRYLVVDTKNGRKGKKVLIAPQWIERVSWSESKAYVDLSCKTIEQSPEYTEDSVLDRDYETALHQNYNQRGYWSDSAVIDRSLT